MASSRVIPLLKGIADDIVKAHCIRPQVAHCLDEV